LKKTSPESGDRRFKSGLVRRYEALYEIAAEPRLLPDIPAGADLKSPKNKSPLDRPRGLEERKSGVQAAGNREVAFYGVFD